MLYETTLVVEQVNKEHESLGLENSSQIKYLNLQIDIADIKYHHAYEHETDNGEYVDGTIIRFYDGDMLATLADYNEVTELRNKYEKETTINFEIGGKEDESE